MTLLTSTIELIGGQNPLNSTIALNHDYISDIFLEEAYQQNKAQNRETLSILPATKDRADIRNDT